MRNRRFPKIRDVPAPFARSVSSDSGEEKTGQYIWRTAGDGDVRPEHAAREGQVFDWSNPPKGGHPGEDYGCRCVAEPIIKTPNCDKVRADVLKADTEVKELTENLHDLLIDADDLIEEGRRLIRRSSENLGARVASFIIGLPFERIGVLGELLQRLLGGIISEEFINASENFMREHWIAKEKAKEKIKQADSVRVRLKEAAKNLEEAKERLSKCEES